MTNQATAELQNFKFKKTIAALESRDKSEIEIAFTLVSEIGPASKRGAKDGSIALLKQVSQTILAETGREISVAMLARWRTIGTNFTLEQIPLYAPFAILDAAGTPARLDTVIAAHPNTTLTREIVREHLKAVDAEARAEKRAAKVAAAEASVYGANQTLATSYNDKERKKAEKARDKALKTIEATGQRAPESNFRKMMKAVDRTITDLGNVLSPERLNELSVGEKKILASKCRECLESMVSNFEEAA